MEFSDHKKKMWKMPIRNSLILSFKAVVGTPIHKHILDWTLAEVEDWSMPEKGNEGEDRTVKH